MKRVVIVLLICLVVLPLVLYAQPDVMRPLNEGGPAPGNPNDPAVPIDGGLLYLLIGGIVLGVKKLMDMRKGR